MSLARFIDSMQRPSFTIVVILLCLQVLARAQEANPAVNYEGQPVVAVDLITDPNRPVTGFRHLITQQAGQPYSNQKVQASIQALERTGMFKGVNLEVKPEAAGLHVIFVLEPAYYYGVVKFPGATKQFVYTRLLQIVNLPDQDPYEADGVENGKKALLDFFRKQGFFQATVEPTIEFDKQFGLANVVYNVQLRKRAKIGNVVVEGPAPAEAQRLLATTRTFRAKFVGAALSSGKPYSPKRVNAGTELIKRYLIKHDRLASKVEAEPPQYRAETNRADFKIKVDEGPRVAVRINGARLSWFPLVSGRQQKKIIPIYQEGSVDPDLVAEGERNIINYFQGKGYFDTKVKTDFQKKDGQISLVYNVDKGRKHKVAEIAFKGNRHADEDKLEETVAVKKGSFLSHGKFSNKLLQESVKNLKAFYQDQGFEQVSITPEVVDKEPKIYVTFQIAEGPQTLVTNLQLEGNNAFSKAALSPSGGFLIRSGAPYSPGRVAKDRGKILAVYLDHGYLTANVKTQVQRVGNDPTRVNVVYQIEEGQQVRIDQVAMIGHKRTQPRIIARTAQLRTETPLSQGKLLASESELYNLGIFDWASVGPRRPITNQTDEEAVVKVHEAKRNTMSYGFGLEISRRGGNVPGGTIAVPGLPTISTNGATVAPSEATFVSPRGSFEFTRRNLRGLAETGSISLLVSRLDNRVIATYSDPNFRWTNWSSLFSGSAERTTENPLFAAQLENVSFQLERSLNQPRTTTLQLRYSFQQTNLSQILVPALVLPGDRNVQISMFSGTLIHDTRDKPLDAHRGWYNTVDLGIVGKAIGASTNFGRLFGQVARYQEIGHGIVWANRIQLGLEKPYGNATIPTSERFFTGGSTTLRGFPVQGAGPQRVTPFCGNPTNPSTCTNITIPVGGPQVFVLNSEFRVPLPDLPFVDHNLGVVGFYDGGNVSSAISLAHLVDDYSNTVGVGIRYNTPIGPVRFDIGRNLNPVPGFRATQFYFSIGQAF